MCSAAETWLYTCLYCILTWSLPNIYLGSEELSWVAVLTLVFFFLRNTHTFFHRGCPGQWGFSFHPLSQKPGSLSTVCWWRLTFPSVYVWGIFVENHGAAVWVPFWILNSIPGVLVPLYSAVKHLEKVEIRENPISSIIHLAHDYLGCLFTQGLPFFTYTWM